MKRTEVLAKKKASMVPEVKATAIVRAVLKIKLESTWGKECTVSQVETQARQEVSEMLGMGPLYTTGDTKRKVVLEGEPKVEVVLVQEE